MAASSEPVSAPLTPAQIAIVKSTAPLLKEHGVDITGLFYKNMISAHPELNNIFNRTSQVTGAQPRALAGAVFAYASYVDDLGKLSDAVAKIAHKHVSLVVQPDQYPIVGKYLIEAVAAVLGDAVTPEVAEAWTAAYGALADIFINTEKQLYGSWGEWTDWRRFRIQKKVAESSEISSFYLAPEDGKPLPPFQPGQYTSLRIFIPEMGCMQPRQYSMSDAPSGDCYRISVKKEAGKQTGIKGLISNLLHDKFNEGDVVEITHPTGPFTMDPDDKSTTPVVLISAGVGITPMMSILNSLVAAGSTRPVSWLHGAHSTEVQAFDDHTKSVATAHSNVLTTIFKTTVQESEVEGVDYNFVGRIDLRKVDQPRQLFLNNASTNYYICGPTYFMHDVRNFLAQAGVGSERIHQENFGTGDGE